MLGTSIISLRNFALVIVVVLCLEASRHCAFGFGHTGHRVVGRIAELHLSHAAREGVKKILGAETLAEVSAWADDIRSDPKWRHSQTWHYVTIDDGQTYQTSKKNSHGDVIEAINRFAKLLKDSQAPREDKAIALKWLVHLVGDIHQPLHVGRRADRGGNTIRVKWFGRDTNVHAVWDSKMIESTKLSFSEMAIFINNKITANQVKKWQHTTVESWARESMVYRAKAYMRPGPEASDSFKYSYENLPLVRQRLAQAGIRLAGMLDQIFSQ